MFQSVLQDLILEGLRTQSGAAGASLVATCGLQMRGVTIDARRRIGTDTWSVAFRSAVQGRSAVAVRRDGIDIGRTYERSLVVVAGASTLLDLADDPTIPPGYTPSASAVVQWPQVEGADFYEVRDGEGNLLGTITDDGSEYYSFETDPLEDGETYDLSVVACEEGSGVESVATVVSGAIVATPSCAATITHSTGLTATATED